MDETDDARSPIRFARAGSTNIAYQVFGNGPPTVVSIPPMAQNVEHCWGWPGIRAMLERFGSFCRFVHFDKRGTGASDRNVSLPEVDQRVDDLRAVMDAVDIDRAFLLGTSEGGPMALLYAATYPARVAGVILDGSGARLIDREQPEPDEGRHEQLVQFANAWGTPDTLTPELFAPSLVDDPEFRAWHAGYERQSASRDAIVTLMNMNGLMDVREILPQITVPALLLHRTDDPITPVRFAYEAAEAMPNARVVEFPGADHFAYASDLDAIMDTIEHFVTGAVAAPATRPPTASADSTRRRRPQVEVTTLGRFAVTIDGDEVDPSMWGSRRARQLLKRLIVAEGWPVTRDELCDLLWPDEPDHDRLRPRLSVQLSTVRRILDGGVVADRSTIRLDVEHVQCDLIAFNQLDDPRSIFESYLGDLLPDDEYEDWAGPPRATARHRFVIAARQLIDDALAIGSHLEAAAIGTRILTFDPYDDPAHRSVIAGLHAGGSHGSAREAYESYAVRMTELGVQPEPIDTILAAI